MSRTNNSHFGIRFSIRTLFLVALILGVAGGWLGAKRLESKKRRLAISTLSDVLVKGGYLNSVADETNSQWMRFRTRGMETIEFDHSSFEIPRWITTITGPECFQSVSRINLSGFPVTDNDITKISHLRETKSLDLQRTMIGDAGVAAFGKLKSLKFICLGQSKITDKGLECLSKHQHLTTVVLWKNDISDEGIRHLANIRGLKKLNVCATKVTDTGVAKLQDALPECEIWWDGFEPFKLINQCPHFMGSFQTYNPSTIIRTVNHLQPLKKERVIEILDEYTHVAPGESYPLLSNSELGGYCQTKLRSIMSVLFVPRAPEQGIPQRPKGSFFPYAISSEWPQSLVALSGGIPFQTIQIGVRTGEPIGSCRFLLDWACDNCDLRESPLVPTHQPRVAAKELIEKHNIRYPQAWNKLKAADLEVQIQNMLKHIDQPCNKFTRDSDEQQYTGLK